MVYQFRFPDVGEGIAEGEIVKWHVKEGDTVKEDQIIAEIETDKAVVEIPSPRSGVIVRLYGGVGSVIKVGDVICDIDDGSAGGSVSSVGKTVESKTKEVGGVSKAAGEAAEAAVEKKEAAGAVKENGAKESSVKELPPETETPPPHGPVEKQEEPEHIKEEKEAHVQTVEKTEAVAAVREPTAARVPEATGVVSAARVTGRVLATPSVRKLARELGVDLSTLTGSGSLGRISAEDIRKIQSGEKVVSEKTVEGREVVTKKPAPSVSFERYGKVLKIPFKSTRRMISENLTRSYHTAVHVTSHDDIDVTKLSVLREKEKGRAVKKGYKLTYLAFVVKAVCGALKKHPFVNSSLDEENQVMVLKKYYNIGIAVQTDKGLIVPVVKNADKMSIMEIASEISSLAEKGREGKLKPEDMKGGTFTITNIGGIGGNYFTPIINYPECAIFGTGRTTDRVVVVDGKAAIRKIMPVSLSFDHRLLDGAKAAEFVNEIKALLEDPDYFAVEVV